MLVLQPPVYTLALLWSSVGHGGQCFYHHEALVSADAFTLHIYRDIYKLWGFISSYTFNYVSRCPLLK